MKRSSGKSQSVKRNNILSNPWLTKDVLLRSRLASLLLWWTGSSFVIKKILQVVFRSSSSQKGSHSLQAPSSLVWSCASSLYIPNGMIKTWKMPWNKGSLVPCRSRRWSIRSTTSHIYVPLFYGSIFCFSFPPSFKWQDKKSSDCPRVSAVSWQTIRDQVLFCSGHTFLSLDGTVQEFERQTERERSTPKIWYVARLCSYRTVSSNSSLYNAFGGWRQTSFTYWFWFWFFERTRQKEVK